MHLSWITKEGRTTITKIKIGEKVYKIKGIINIKRGRNLVEKVLELGEKIK